MRLTYLCSLMPAAMLLPIAQPAPLFAQAEVISQRTAISLTIEVDPAGQGRARLSADVSVHLGAGVPDGRITFLDLTTMQALGWTSVAEPHLTVDGLAPGRHVIRADYSGSAAHLPLIVLPSQSAEVPLEVRVRPALTLSSSNGPDTPGELVTLSVAASGSIGVPTGTVTFRDGDSVIAAHVPLDHAGAAAFTTSALQAGRRSILVQYDGDARYAKADAQIELEVMSSLASAESRM